MSSRASKVGTNNSETAFRKRQSIWLFRVLVGLSLFTGAWSTTVVVTPDG